jgi:hypothetical protein
MERLGRFVFAGGAAVSVLAGVISTLNLGTICALGEGPPASMLSYPALCFMFWAYGVPLGLILAATGVLMMAGAPGGRTAAFAVCVFVVYAAIVIANDPMPHVPPLFGIGGALILGFYFSILWMHAGDLARNLPKLAGYTSLVTGLWFTCGMAARPYHDVFGVQQSPIDIMTYFVIGMGLLWWGERCARRVETGPARRMREQAA